MIRSLKSPATTAPATSPPCRHCGGALVVTRDAIGRPRYRCPECQGVSPTPMPAGSLGTQHPQTATSSRDRHWGAPAPQSGPARQVVAPDRRT